jgi:beta-glucosidase
VKSKPLQIEKRVSALLAKMTLDEKVGQMTQLNSVHPGHDEQIRKGRVGSLLNVTNPEDIARYQTIAREESRLGIPILFGYDVIHGYQTTFPIPLAEAASFDIECVEASARVAGREAAAQGIHWTFAPMVDVARDARWGRIAEGSGEDVHLGCEMARARVRGFQGDDVTHEESVAACAKHFVAYGGAEGGRDYHTVDVSERTLREVYLPPFKAALDEGCFTVMSAFNEIGGIPASSSEFTLRRVLKGEWKFDGMVLSDWDSLGETVFHGHAADRVEAAERCALSGVDMDMPGTTYGPHLARLVKQKKVPLKLIDDAVRRILRVKMRLGLYDRPLPSAEKAKATRERADHREAALRMARRSMVLLKNEGATLPLAKGPGKVALVGPLADNRRDVLGTWSAKGRPEDVTTVLAGIRAVSPETTVSHVAGCDFVGDDRSGFDETVRAARESDVVVAVLGERQDMSGEAHSRTDIGLPGPQLDLLKALHATGKPIVLVVMNGRPMSLPWEAEHVPAILIAWHLGITAGTAVAEALFGDTNPSGKLPVSFPRSAGHCPIYYSIKPSGRPKGSTVDLKVGYVDAPMEPLYPFGHGLSYARFTYSDLAISPAKVPAYGKVKISAVVRNVSNRAGDEVVQLYVRDPVANTTRPVQELKGFQRITLAAGETRKVMFELDTANLAFYDTRMKLVVEPGTIQVWLGTSSRDNLEGSFEIVAARKNARRAAR